MSRSHIARFALAGSLTALAGCALLPSVNVHKGPTYGGDQGLNPRIGLQPSVARSGTRDPSATKQVCRAGGREPGWIAIDYVPGDGCALQRGSQNPIAVVTKYANLPINTELEVCADEHTPSGWTIAGWPEGDDRCPPENATGGGRRVKRIRRLN